MSDCLIVSILGNHYLVHKEGISFVPEVTETIAVDSDSDPDSDNSASDSEDGAVDIIHGATNCNAPRNVASHCNDSSVGLCIIV